MTVKARHLFRIYKKGTNPAQSKSKPYLDNALVRTISSVTASTT